MEDIEINIVELSNSVKVVNLLPNPIHFDDGTVVPPTRYRLRLSTLKRTAEPPNAEVWRDNATPKANYVNLIKADTVPRVEDLEWLRNNIPKDVLVLTKRAAAQIWGFLASLLTFHRGSMKRRLHTIPTLSCGLTIRYRYYRESYRYRYNCTRISNEEEGALRIKT